MATLDELCWKVDKTWSGGEGSAGKRILASEPDRPGGSPPRTAVFWRKLSRNVSLRTPSMACRERCRKNGRTAGASMPVHVASGANGDFP